NIKGYMTYPDSLNPYVYIYNQPEDYVDEDGNIAIPVAAITVLKLIGAGATAGLAKQAGSDIWTNYKEHKLDTSEWEWSPGRDYAGSAAGGAVAYPLSHLYPTAALGAGTFVETW